MKMCTHCHEAKVLDEFTKHPTTRDRRGSWCKPCTREAARRIRQERPEECRAQVKVWQDKNPDRVRQTKQAWYQTNRETLIAAERRRRVARRLAGIKPKPSARSLGEKRAYMQEWQKRNLPRINAYHRAYYAAQPQKVRSWWHRRRARIAGNGGTYTQQQWTDMCAAYGYRCLRCGEQKTLTVDHVVPLTKGGANAICNIQPLCRSCNARKKTHSIDYRTSGLLLWF